MGVRPKLGCERLAEKLLAIRKGLELSQSELVHRLGLRNKKIGATIIQQNISSYEHGQNEPPLPVLLEYARMAGVCADLLIDDEQNLPKRLPAKPKHNP